MDVQSRMFSSMLSWPDFINRPAAVATAEEFLTAACAASHTSCASFVHTGHDTIDSKCCHTSGSIVFEISLYQHGQAMLIPQPVQGVNAVR